MISRRLRALLQRLLLGEKAESANRVRIVFESVDAARVELSVDANDLLSDGLIPLAASLVPAFRDLDSSPYKQWAQVTDDQIENVRQHLLLTSFGIFSALLRRGESESNEAKALLAAMDSVEMVRGVFDTIGHGRETLDIVDWAQSLPELMARIERSDLSRDVIDAIRQNARSRQASGRDAIPGSVFEEPRRSDEPLVPEPVNDAEPAQPHDEPQNDEPHNSGTTSGWRSEPAAEQFFASSAGRLKQGSAMVLTRDYSRGPLSRPLKKGTSVLVTRIYKGFTGTYVDVRLGDGSFIRKVPYDYFRP